MADQNTDPFDERQSWWWRIVLPLVGGFACLLWSLIGLGHLQESHHQDLYALLAYADSAGTGEIHWKPGGEHLAFQLLTLPFWAGVASMTSSLLIGSFGMRRLGWATLVGYWLFGLFCALGFAAIMGWLWISAIGVFI